MLDPALLARSGHSAHALVNARTLRLTTQTLAQGGDLSELYTDGPVSIQMFEGGAACSALANEYTVATNDTLVLAQGVRHLERSPNG